MSDEQDRVDEVARRLFQQLRKSVPTGTGFALVVFSQKTGPEDDGPGAVSYIATGSNEGVSSLLRDVAARLSPS